MLSEHAEEILEALWIQIEEQGKKPMDVGAFRDDPAIEELIKLGFIRRDDAHIHLLEAGRLHALACVRRHRLAERLLTDLLDIRENVMDTVSCKFEHLLHEGLEDKVCIILGHPKTCPHGKKIPPGKCCLEKRDKKLLKIISSLTDLETKEKGQIAYLETKNASQMQKLISIGAIPGVPIVLVQKFPSYVFKIGHSQFAIDKELASSIYVRLTK
ncbi:MAG: metal-dependent transcriptional regulator [Candidatus Omnitrophica bacterium]|nr:metal-dependent transcriptional regulator [Candidatus Omnitrophota bacterium]